MLLRKHFRRDSKIRYLRHKTLKTSVKNHYFFVKIFTKFDLPSRKSVCELIDDPLFWGNSYQIRIKKKYLMPISEQ